MLGVQALLSCGQCLVHYSLPFLSDAPPGPRSVSGPMPYYVLRAAVECAERKNVLPIYKCRPPLPLFPLIFSISARENDANSPKPSYFCRNNKVVS